MSRQNQHERGSSQETGTRRPVRLHAEVHRCLSRLRRLLRAGFHQPDNPGIRSLVRRHDIEAFQTIEVRHLLPELVIERNKFGARLIPMKTGQSPSTSAAPDRQRIDMPSTISASA
jgi:hypothetical protein